MSCLVFLVFVYFTHILLTLPRETAKLIFSYHKRFSLLVSFTEDHRWFLTMFFTLSKGNCQAGSQPRRTYWKSSGLWNGPENTPVSNHHNSYPHFCFGLYYLWNGPENTPVTTITRSHSHTHTHTPLSLSNDMIFCNWHYRTKTFTGHLWVS